MQEFHEICEDLRSKGVKDLKKLTEKAELSPTEWANAKTVLSAMCKINELEQGDRPGESYNSYGMPMNYYDYDLDYSMDRGNSSRRGRNMRTGRYVSMSGPSYDDRMSGHSITDRMVDLIERMYDQAKTEHERRELDKWITRIQNGD